MPLSVKPPVVRLSLSVDPLVAIVGRHVKLSPQARSAIRRDLAAAFESGNVELQTDASEPRSSDQEESDLVLTTEGAAQLAGVSRPYMAKLIDNGSVDLHQMVGNQRRVLRSAVLRWQQGERARQAKALRRVAQDLDAEIFGT